MTSQIHLVSLQIKNVDLCLLWNWPIIFFIFKILFSQLSLFKGINKIWVMKKIFVVKRDQTRLIPWIIHEMCALMNLIILIVNFLINLMSFNQLDANLI